MSENGKIDSEQQLDGVTAFASSDAGCELTATQAAAVLNVSQQFVIELLESGALPFTKVGAQRRVKLSVVRAYQERRQRSAAAMEELTRIAQENDMGY